jgi:hypothetical protein
MGGLGNQMFQISKSIAEGLKNNIPVFFRTSAFIPMEGNQPINYTKNIFRNLNFDDSKIPTFRINEQTWSYYETNHIYTEPTEFYGYYQSSKNFLGYDNKIKELFSIDGETKKYLTDKYPQILLDNTLSIHIRRGDYKQFPMVHPTVSKSYIDKSIGSIGGYSHVFIFSDDKQWVKENLNLINSTIVDEKDYIELWLMSLCKNNILSNSSFSWWGSFLNRNDDKKVIAPSIWFGPNGPNNYSDIFEDNWVMLNVEFVNGELIFK